MRVIMFDRQSIFIHGAIGSLRGIIPEINIDGTSQADELWPLLTASPAAIVMIDGSLHREYCLWLLDELNSRFPALRVVMVLAKKEADWVEQLVQRNVMAIVPRHSSADMYASVLRMVASGMMCCPGEWLKSALQPQYELASLSERQREVLKLLAEGESNKEISRALNISAGTVKAHLETLFRLLDVKNRTQAAMLYTRVA
ncbi:MAG: response regulator transcription factor [Enterobacter sp.]|jgi:DNA-binding NarL/FixJ family response regulator|nr:response regulator transcription factor [Enterobacter sp.]